MSQPAVTWGQLKKYLTKNGYRLYHAGGDVIVHKAPRKHRIGHHYCNSHTDIISKGHLAKLKQKFCITRDDILGP